jgi:hypothetical protein
LWMCCQEGRKLTLETYIRMLTKLRKQFGLTSIQHKSCFSMKMQGWTQVSRLRKPSQNLVWRCYPIHPTALI